MRLPHLAVRHVSGGSGKHRATVAAVPYFSELAELMEVAVFVVRDADLVYVNHACTRMTGYERDELLRMKFWEVVHPDERPTARERGFARQGGADVPQQLPYRLYTKSGDTLW